METHILIAGPDDLVGRETHIRDRIVGMNGIGDDLVPAILQADIVPDPAVMAIGVVDIADVLLFPDPVRDADDVVDDIFVFGLESAHRLASDMIRGLVEKFPRAAASIGFERDREILGHVVVGKGDEAEMRRLVFR